MNVLISAQESCIFHLIVEIDSATDNGVAEFLHGVKSEAPFLFDENSILSANALNDYNNSNWLTNHPLKHLCAIIKRKLIKSNIYIYFWVQKKKKTNSRTTEMDDWTCKYWNIFSLFFEPANAQSEQKIKHIKFEFKLLKYLINRKSQR